MTVAVVAAPVQRATVLATVERVRRRGGASRVLGISASRPLEGAEGLTDQHGDPVTVTWCPSALACWDALASWDQNGWLVLLTDRTEEELGSGLLARLAQHRLQRPDAWESVKLRFRATSLDRALLRDSTEHRSAIPEALLRIEPQTGWPAARAGMLNREVAYGAVARHHLGINAETLDGASVLEATLAPDLPTRLADLRRDGGDELTDAVLDWLAGRLGPGAAPARHVLATGTTGDLLPLGLALSHVVTAPAAFLQEAVLTGARLEASLPNAFRGATNTGAAGAPAEQLRSLAAEKGVTVNTVLQTVWTLALSTHTGRRDVVFGQPVLHVAGLLLTIVAVVAFILPRETAAPSFWCGILGAPVFFGIGLWCLLAGRSALAAG